MIAIPTRPGFHRIGEIAGIAVLLVAAAAILAALAFEHIGGYVPCPLCLQQRYAYYAAIPLAAAALWLDRSGNGRFASLLFAAVALAFLANAGLGVYQAGAEWKFWPGPSSCAGSRDLATDAGSLLKNLAETRVVKCDEASWRLAGLSFAGWNAVISAALFVASLFAGLRNSKETPEL